MRRDLSEAEVAIARGSVVIDRVGDDRASPELGASPHAPPQRIHEQMTSQALALFGSVERESSEYDDRDGIRHSPPNTGGRGFMRDRTHRKRVVPHNAIAAREDVCGSRPCRGGGASRVAQPAVEGRAAAVEVLDAVPVSEQLDRAELLAGQRVGIGLRLRA